MADSKISALAAAASAADANELAINEAGTSKKLTVAQIKTLISAATLGLPLALTGATAATRYVGATATGAPTSGTFAVGDFVITQDGSVYICTGAGSPGTWAAAGGGDMATDALWDAAGDLAVGSGPNAAGKLTKGSDNHVLTISASTHVPVWAAPAVLAASGATIDNYDTITSATYAAAPGHPGPEVTVTVGSSGILIVGFGGDWTGTAVNGFMSVALSGANTVASTDERAYFGVRKAGVSFLISGLAAGSTTITAQYRKTATGDFGRRHLWALAL